MVPICGQIDPITKGRDVMQTNVKRLYYIESYYADGGQIYGTTNGQGIISAKQYKRTNKYKWLCGINTPNERKYSRVAYFVITDYDGAPVEKITNPYHREG